MRTHSLWLRLGFFCLSGVGLVSPLSAVASDVQVQAVLIYASDEPAPADPRLADIEPQLRKVLGFAYYSHYGEGDAKVELPGSATIRLGRGYTLQVEASQAARGRIRLQVSWRKGEKGLMSTSTLVSRGGAPAILGGPSHKNGKLIVAVTLK